MTAKLNQTHQSLSREQDCNLDNRKGVTLAYILTSPKFFVTCDHVVTKILAPITRITVSAVFGKGEGRRQTLRKTTERTLFHFVIAFILLGAIFALTGGAVAQQQGPQAGRNVNMVAGTEWPGGDPFRQRQDEPALAISTRN